jgi:FimV-like protein
VELARELALFREVVLEVTNIRGEGRRPTHLLVLDAETYRRLAPFGSAGVFYAGARFDSMAISEIPAHQRANQEFSEEHVLRHEYAHFLVANEQTARYPVWFEEGWAELLSTIHVRDEVVFVGAEHPLRARQLRSMRPWLRLKDLLSHERRPRNVSLYYAQAWSLVHFLQLGSPDRAQFRDRLARYVRALNGGASVEDAFEQSFGWQLEALEQRLASYAFFETLPHLEIPRSRFAPPVEPAPRIAKPSVVAAALGAFAFQAGRASTAEKYHRAGIALDPESAANHAGLGRALAAGGHEWEEALHHVRKALALAPEDPERMLDLAVVLLDRAGSSDPAPTPNDPGLAEVRELCSAAIRSDDTSPEARFLLGRSFLAAGQYEDSVHPLEGAHERLPTNPEIQIALARAYAETGRREKALALLTEVMAFSHGGSHREAEDLAEQIRREIETEPSSDERSDES